MNLVRSIAVLMVASLPASARAQEAGGPGAALQALGVRSLVRVEVASGERFFGRLLVVTPDSLVVSSPLPGGVRTEPMASIVRAWRQDGTYAWRYAQVGGIAGAVLGAWMFYSLSGLDDRPDACRWCYVPVGALGGGVTGLVLGGVVGGLRPRWQVVYPEAGRMP